MADLLHVCGQRVCTEARQSPPKRLPRNSYTPYTSPKMAWIQTRRTTMHSLGVRIIRVGLELVIQCRRSFPKPPGSTPAFERPLLPQLRHGHLLVIVFVENLGSGQIKVFLCDMNPTLAECIHACLRADTLQLGSRAPVHLLGNLGQVDPTGQVHRPRVDPQDVGTSFDPTKEK